MTGPQSVEVYFSAEMVGALTKMYNLFCASAAVFRAGAKRVVTDIKIDDRRDKPWGMEDQVEAYVYCKTLYLKKAQCTNHNGGLRRLILCIERS